MADIKEDLYSKWVASVKRKDSDVLQISDDRHYAFNEEEYSNLRPQLGPASPGAALRHLIDAKQGAILELGCGHGYLSASLAEQFSDHPILISDASPKFVELTRKNILKAGLGRPNIDFAILNLDDMDKLPDAGFKLIVLANTLHHIVDFKGAIRSIYSKLAPGGAFVFQEPLGEGLFLLGTLFEEIFQKNSYHRQSLPRKLLRKMGFLKSSVLGVEDSVAVSNFAQFICEMRRRDQDKHHLEDKHLFCVSEFWMLAEELGARSKFFPNHVLGPDIFDEKKSQGYKSFVEGYVEHCLGWRPDRTRRILELMNPILTYIDQASKGRHAPLVQGVFAFYKPSSKP